MKKATSLLITLAIVMLFSSLILFIFEIKSLKSENLKNSYLQTQAKLHEAFLTQVVSHIKNDESIETLSYEDKLFELKIIVTPTQFDLYVQAYNYPIALHKTIIK